MARPEPLSKSDSRSGRSERPTVSPGRDRHVGGQPRLDLAVLGVDRDDLRGAEILGAEDRAAQPRAVVEADVLGPDAEREIASRRGPREAPAPRLSAPLTRTRVAPGARAPGSRKFIGGEPMKSATNMDAGRS